MSHLTFKSHFKISINTTLSIVVENFIQILIHTKNIILIINFDTIGRFFVVDFYLILAQESPNKEPENSICMGLDITNP